MQKYKQLTNNTQTRFYSNDKYIVKLNIMVHTSKKLMLFSKQHI